jgi:hypothetical protein
LGILPTDSRALHRAQTVGQMVFVPPGQELASQGNSYISPTAPEHLGLHLRTDVVTRMFVIFG